MSRLLQALKNLEARPKPAAVGAAFGSANQETGLLGHLADGAHTPSPDPPPCTHDDSSDACRPSPVSPLIPDHPLACLSTGMPTMLLDRPAAWADAPSPAESLAPAVTLPPSLEDVPTPPPAFEHSAAMPPAAPPVEPPSAWSPIAAESTLRDAERLLDNAAHIYEQPSSPSDIEPPAAKLQSPIPGIESPAADETPSRQPTLLERAIRRTLAEPDRSEPIRQLADRLRADLDQVAGRSILLTGVGPASETHDVILSTAAVLAEAGEPVLVIDADATRHLLTSQLDLTGTGLAELARGQEPDADPICPTALDNLSILPMGKARLPDPASVANRLAALVQSLEEEYRFVLIDGGRTTDRHAPALARLSDATYFVVHLGETEVPQAQSALRDFRAAGARLLGCIATS